MSTPSPERRSLFRSKPVEAFVTETGPDAEGGELSRSIGLFQLTMFGVGATIGTGVFIVLTEAVPEAGPGGRDALALGRMLTRTGDVTLIVCIVLPEV